MIWDWFWPWIPQDDPLVKSFNDTQYCCCRFVGGESAPQDQILLILVAFFAVITLFWPTSSHGLTVSPNPTGSEMTGKKSEKSVLSSSNANYGTPMLDSVGSVRLTYWVAAVWTEVHLLYTFWIEFALIITGCQNQLFHNFSFQCLVSTLTYSPSVHRLSFTNRSLKLEF